MINLIAVTYPERYMSNRISCSELRNFGNFMITKSFAVNQKAKNIPQNKIK